MLNPNGVCASSLDTNNFERVFFMLYKKKTLCVRGTTRTLTIALHLNILYNHIDEMERISKRVLHKPQGILGCSMKQGMEEPK
jgi:hypothetical protein